MRLAQLNPQSFACPRRALRESCLPADLLAFLLTCAFNFFTDAPRRIALEMFERRAIVGRLSEFNTENTEKNHRVHRALMEKKKK